MPDWLPKLERAAMLSTEALSQEKVFCIGCNKTGTTSLKLALHDLGYRVGLQLSGELLLKKYLARDFTPIVEFCTTADAFQDIPFSLPYTYVILDHYFRNAKYILSVRDSDEQWFSSLVSFHSTVLGGGSVPTIDTLKKHPYAYEGFCWDAKCRAMPSTESDPYDKQSNLAFYNDHNRSVRTYFREKNNLLELNLAEPGAYLKFCRFLGREPVAEDFPWANRS